MSKIEEKGKVGRPKLADEELVKDAWCRVICCIVAVLVLTVCGMGVLTDQKPSQVLMLTEVEDLSGSAARLRDPNTKVIDVDSLGNSRTISAKSSTRKISSLDTKTVQAKQSTKRVIDTNGNVTNVIPAIRTKVIKID